jgi:flagellar hook-associated protein 1
MLGLRDEKLLNSSTATLDDFYQGMIGSLAVQAASATTLSGNQQVLHNQLTNEREMISGVNIDEETIDLIGHQRAFQAAARYISVIDELLNTLVNAT